MSLFIKIVKAFKDLEVKEKAQRELTERKLLELKEKEAAMDTVTFAYPAKIDEEERDGERVYKVLLRDFREQPYYLFASTCTPDFALDALVRHRISIGEELPPVSTLQEGEVLLSTVISKEDIEELKS